MMTDLVALPDDELVVLPDYAKHRQHQRLRASARAHAAAAAGINGRLEMVNQMLRALRGSSRRTGHHDDADVTGPGDSLLQLCNAFDHLGNRPGDTGRREHVLRHGQNLASDIGLVHARWRLLADQTVLMARADGDRINRLVTRIAQLNRHERPNEVRATRDRLLDQLAKLLPIQVSDTLDGTFIASVEGRPLVVDGRPYSLQVSPIDPPEGSSRTHRSIAVDLAGERISISHGRLGGWIVASTIDIGGGLERISTLTITMADLINSVHVAGTGLDGIAGRQFFAANRAGTSPLVVSRVLIGHPERVAAAAPGRGPLDNGTARLIGQMGQALAAPPDGLDCLAVSLRRRQHELIDAASRIGATANMSANFIETMGTNEPRELLRRQYLAWETATDLLERLDSLLEPG